MKQRSSLIALSVLVIAMITGCTSRGVALVPTVNGVSPVDPMVISSLATRDPGTSTYKLHARIPLTKEGRTYNRLKGCTLQDTQGRCLRSSPVLNAQNGLSEAEMWGIIILTGIAGYYVFDWLAGGDCKLGEGESDSGIASYELDDYDGCDCQRDGSIGYNPSITTYRCSG